MAFLFPLIGSVLGAIGGFSLGEMMHAGYGGAVFDMRYPLMLVGVVVGYFIGRLVAGKPSDKSESESE